MLKQIMWAIVAIVVLGGAYLLFTSSSAPASGGNVPATVTDAGTGSQTDQGTGSTPSTGSGQAGSPQAGVQVNAGATVTTGAAASAAVSYDGTSFSPREVTIKQGGTVTWTNTSSGPMDVASAPHPQHTDYPGFDQDGSGGNYSFTFTKTGDWKYHNHRNPSANGIVHVVQ